MNKCNCDLQFLFFQPFLDVLCSPFPEKFASLVGIVLL